MQRALRSVQPWQCPTGWSARMGQLHYMLAESDTQPSHLRSNTRFLMATLVQKIICSSTVVQGQAITPKWKQVKTHCMWARSQRQGRTARAQMKAPTPGHVWTTGHDVGLLGWIQKSRLLECNNIYQRVLSALSSTIVSQGDGTTVQHTGSWVKYKPSTRIKFGWSVAHIQRIQGQLLKPKFPILILNCWIPLLDQKWNLNRTHGPCLSYHHHHLCLHHPHPPHYYTLTLVLGRRSPLQNVCLWSSYGPKR